MRYRVRRQLPLGGALGLALLAGLSACAPAKPTSTPETPNTPPPLAYTKVLKHPRDFEKAEAHITAALKAQGFGIITRIDVQATMKEKLGKEMRPYVILGACNPGFALRTLERDPIMGLLLPCKVILYERPDGELVVSLARPKSMFTLVSVPGLESVAEDVESRFRKVFDSL